jgi:hypothetical protein
VYFEKNVLPADSHVVFFYSVIPILHDCSLCNLLGAAIPRLNLKVGIATGWDTL